MYSKRWLYVIVFVLLVGAILREESLVIVAALAAFALGSAWLWNHYVLCGVSYERVFGQTRVFPGEKVDVIIRVTNRKLLPVPWLEAADEFPTKLPLTKGKLEVTSVPTIGLLSHLVALRWFERVSWRHQLEATSRGYYAFGPLTLRSGDLFGLYTSEERREDRSYLIVYPRVVPLQRLGLPAKQPFGDLHSPRRIFEDPSRTVGIRDYQHGDGFKRIHWKATARRQALQVRVYEPTAIPQLSIFLNICTFEHFWQGVDTDVLEGSITIAASLAHYALGEGYATGLYANAPLVQGDQTIRVHPSRSPQQVVAILEALAKLNPFALTTIEALLANETPRLPWGATVVVITAVVTPGLAAVLGRLREAGRQTVLLKCGDSSTSTLTDDILTYHIRADQVLRG